MKTDSFSVTGKRKIKDKINRKRKKSHQQIIWISKNIELKEETAVKHQSTLFPEIEELNFKKQKYLF